MVDLSLTGSDHTTISATNQLGSRVNQTMAHRSFRFLLIVNPTTRCDLFRWPLLLLPKMYGPHRDRESTNQGHTSISDHANISANFLECIVGLPLRLQRWTIVAQHLPSPCIPRLTPRILRLL